MTKKTAGAADEAKSKIAERIKITLGDQQVELFMSFGLLNELVGLVGNTAMVGLIPTDAELGRLVLRAVLAKRDEKGVILEEPNLFDGSVSHASAGVIYAWVMGHTLDFFLRSLRTAAQIGEMFNKEMAEMFPPSPSGSESSPSATPSAGPAA